MERWQRAHITRHIDVLIGDTDCSTNLLAQLQSRGILGNVDLDRLNVTHGKYEKAKLLYDIVQTRSGSYAVLMEALSDNSQTSPLNILLDGFVFHSLSDITISHHGPLKDVLTDKQRMLLQSSLKSQVTAEDCSDFLRANPTGNESLKLVNGNIPPSLPYYIPRLLVKHAQLNTAAFNVICSDIFVFKGLERVELTNLAKPEKTSTSKSQVKKLTVRFILLECDDHWKELCSASEVPIHLINFEDDKYVVEDSSGGFKSIRQYLGPLYRKGHPVLSSETKIIKMSQGHERSVTCICDHPGMGKTAMLSSIARKISTRYPENVTAFISLPNFISSLGSPLPPLGGGIPMIKKLVYGYISPTAITRNILFSLMTENNIRMQLFFDGFDEVSHNDLQWTKNFLSQAKSLINTNIYVTSRAHKRQDLEETMGVIGYDIQPLSEGNQVDFLVEFWRAEGESLNQPEVESRLKKFALHALNEFKKNVSAGERNIAGIPLQCRLLGEVFRRRALKYAQNKEEGLEEPSEYFAFSMFEVYKKFIDLRLSKVDMKFDTKSDMTIDPLTDFSITKNIMEAITGESICQSDLKAIKNFHLWKAFEIIFPEVSDEIADFLGVDISTPISNFIQFGLVETVAPTADSSSVTIRFIHRTLAEYLISEFFAKLCTGHYVLDHNQNVIHSGLKILKFLSEHVLKSWMWMEHTDTVDFLNPSLAFFINAHLSVQSHTKFNPSVVSMLEENGFSDNPSNIFLITQCCLRHNYLHLLRVYTQFLMHQKNEALKEYFLQSDKQSLLFSTAAILENSETFEEILSLYRTAFSFKDSNAQPAPSALVLESRKGISQTPLYIAVSKLNYEMLESLVEIFPTEKQDLLRICIRNSYSDSPETLRKRADIAKLLLSCNKNLLHEKFNSISPLLVNNLHLDLMKLAIKSGADTNVKSFMGDTIAHMSAKYMSSNDFHELTRFLIHDVKAGSLYAMKNALGQTSLDIFDSYEIPQIDTVKLIVDCTSQKVAKYSESALACGKWLIESPFFNVISNSDYEMLDALLELYLVENLGLLGVCVRNSYTNSPDVLKTQIAMAALLLRTNKNLVHEKINCSSPLLVQNVHLEVFKVLIKNGADVNVRSFSGDTVAHAAAKYMSSEDYHELASFLITQAHAPHLFLTKNEFGQTPWQITGEWVDPDIATHNLIAVNTKQKFTIYTDSALACGLWIQGTPLHYAIVNLHPDLLKTLLDTYKAEWQGLVQSCVRNSYHDSAEMLEARLEILELILSTNKALLHEKINCNSPLLVENVHLDAIKILCKKGINIKATTYAGNTVAHTTAKYMSAEDYDELVNFLITEANAGSLFVMKNDFGQTPLDVPSNWQIQNVNTLKLIADATGQKLHTFTYSSFPCGKWVVGNQLYDATSNLDCDNVGKLVDIFPIENQDLLLACVRNSYSDPVEILEKRIHITKLLLRCNKKLVNEKSLYGTPLLAENIHPFLVKLLIDEGAFINATTFSGDTIAHTACKYMSPEDYHDLARFLVTTNGANLFAMKNSFGQTPLLLLQNWNSLNIDTMKLVFEETDTDINDTDNNGNNLVHVAVINGEPWSTILDLVNLGVDYSQINGKGQNVLHLAVQSLNVPALGNFIRLGVKNDVRDKFGKRPMDYVDKNERDPICQQLNASIRNLLGERKFSCIIL